MNGPVTTYRIKVVEVYPSKTSDNNVIALQVYTQKGMPAGKMWTYAHQDEETPEVGTIETDVHLSRGPEGFWQFA